MYCKKCGTEQKEGENFCPQCGTPYVNMEQNEPNSSDIEGLTTDKIQEKNNPSGIKQTQESRNGNEKNGTRLLTPNEKKKVVRIAKGGMWIIVIAIVFTFVRAGFGFSFWWYIYLILFALIAFTLFGFTLSDSEGKAKEYDSNDASVVNIISWIGAAMLVILYLWGPLNSDYRSSEEIIVSDKYEKSSSFNDDSYSWLQGTWICNTPYGSIRIVIDGDHISEDYGDGDIMYGTYRISDGVLYPNTNSHAYYPLDMSVHKIGDGRGGYFRKQ